MQRGDAIRSLREDSGLSRECIKTDALIAAIAITNKAIKIITNNERHYKTLVRGLIAVSGVPDVESEAPPLFGD